MSSYIRVRGVGALLSTLSRYRTRTYDGARRAMRKGAKDIAALARLYAPVKFPRLELGIKAARPVDDGKRYRIRVEVGGVVKRRDISTYALTVHEYDMHRRGPATREKGPKAGPKYLKRAFDDLLPDIKQQILKELASAIRETAALGRAKSPRRR
jgi:hypothetical protein